MRPPPFTVTLALASLAAVCASPSPRAPADPCAKIAGETFVPPADALACLKSFPFNATSQKSIIATVSGVFDFFTFEDYYLNSPPPFQESTVDIRKELQRINSTKYATDYDFSKDLYQLTLILNDGHTRWFPACYWSAFQNILPLPPITLSVNGSQSVFIAPDAVEFVSQLGTAYTSFFDALPLDWRALAGAKILTINGLDPYAYADRIASNTSGNYLDHGVRVNSVFTSYRIDSTNAFSQRIGDLAGPVFPEPESVTYTLVRAGAKREETVTVPYLATYLGLPFTDAASYWEANCAANSETNGIDRSATSSLSPKNGPLRARAEITDASLKNALGLPAPFLPTAPPIAGQNGTVKSFILPDNVTGVLFVGSFGGDEETFQQDTVAAVNAFKERGVERLIVDLTNNGGGFVCLGQWLHKFLAGSALVSEPGFQSTSRGNSLAQKIVRADITRNISSNLCDPTHAQAFYPSANWKSLNGTPFPATFDYNDPARPFTVNGRSDPTSQRFLDNCAAEFFEPFPSKPPFDLSKLILVGNGNCASTCAMFSTLMHELHHTRTVIFGGKPGETLQFKGMAGNQVLEWADLDSEIKTAGVKNDPLAPPDLEVNANMRVNWRTAWSFFDENTPIAYISEPASLQFPYTPETYNNPQKIWEFVAAEIL